MGDVWWIERRQPTEFQQGGSSESGHATSLMLSRSVFPCEYTVSSDFVAGRIQSPRRACTAPWPIASYFYLHHTSHTFDHPLQHNPVFALHPHQTFITQVHFPRPCRLFSSVGMPRQMGRPHHTTRRSEGERA